MPRALITGITGQDGSYLAEWLLAKGYHVAGMVLPAGVEPLDRIAHLTGRIQLHSGNLLDQQSLIDLVEKCAPDEVYNFAAQSFVPQSWSAPVLTGDITGLGVARLLEAIRKINPQIKFYQASSSEMFGATRETPQTELTPFCPRNPYGAAKVYGHHLTVNYRKNHGLFAVSGILFNHESPRRGLEFVTRKISHTAARIALGLTTELPMGNLANERDWGYAGDYVEAMWLMLQQPQADDYVIGTGKLHSVRDFVQEAFDYLNLDWEKHVRTDPQLMRPVEVNRLVANPTKARSALGWQPRTDFRQLVRLMVDADLKQLRSQQRTSAL
ncbi:MAG: GDP-mannose 4,6-dehydratase [Verrucomicrobiota bacterium]